MYFAPTGITIYGDFKLLSDSTNVRPPVLLSIFVIRGHLAGGDALEVFGLSCQIDAELLDTTRTGNSSLYSDTSPTCGCVRPPISGSDTSFRKHRPLVKLTRPNSIAWKNWNPETSSMCVHIFVNCLTIQPTERLRVIPIALSNLIFVVPFDIRSDSGIIHTSLNTSESLCAFSSWRVLSLSLWMAQV